MCVKMIAQVTGSHTDTRVCDLKIMFDNELLGWDERGWMVLEIY